MLNKKEVEDNSEIIAKLDKDLNQHTKEKSVIAASLIDVIRPPVHLKLRMMKSNVNLLHLKKSIS